MNLHGEIAIWKKCRHHLVDVYLTLHQIGLFRVFPYVTISTGHTWNSRACPCSCQSFVFIGQSFLDLDLWLVRCLRSHSGWLSCPFKIYPWFYYQITTLLSSYTETDFVLLFCLRPWFHSPCLIYKL